MSFDYIRKRKRPNGFIQGRQEHANDANSHNLNGKYMYTQIFVRRQNDANNTEKKGEEKKNDEVY